MNEMCMSAAPELDYFFDPDRVAFIGASEESSRFVSMYDNLHEYGDDGQETYFINPNRDTVFGKRSYDSIRDVPSDIDLAVIIVPSHVVPTVFEDCCKAGVHTALIVSAGFSEEGKEGQERERKLVELSEEFGVPFCGPNTYGGFSAHDGVAPIQASTLNFDDGNVAAVLQSGGLLNQVLYSGIERGFGFSKVVDSGNEASITAADYIDHMLEDDETNVIVGIIEAFHEPRRFLDVAEKAVDVGKPLVILKMARSEKGGQIAESHTGALTAADDVVVAALKQYGVVQVESLDMLIEIAELFSKKTYTPNEKVSVIEISGGGCALFSDAIAETELDLPDLSSDVVDAIDEHLPPIGVARNPVDMAMGWGAEAMEEAYPNVLRILEEQTDTQLIVSRLSIPQDGPITTTEKHLQTIQKINRNSDKTFVVISRTSGRVSSEWTEMVKDADIPFLQEYHKGIRALDHLQRYSKFTDARKERTQTAPVLPSVDFNPEHGVVTEHRAKRILTELGLETPTEQIVMSEDEAVSAAESIGYPVGLKILSPDIPHKTDVGGVDIGLDTPECVRRSYDEIITTVEDQRPGAEIEGVLVQQMINDGVEVLIGSKRSKFGQAVVCGIGGVFTELVDDTTIRIAPFTADEAQEMLGELEGYGLLKGARGQDPVAVDELAETLALFSAFVAENEVITEADLNPVIVTSEDAYIVDALFHVESE